MKNSRIRECFYSLKNLIYNNGKDLRGMKVEKNSLKLLASRAVNKLGDVLYDYGNSSWIGPWAVLDKRCWEFTKLSKL